MMHTPATCGEESETYIANQVYALATNQLQVERRERHRANQGVCASTTQQRYRWIEEREPIEPSQVNDAHHQLHVERRVRDVL